MEKEQKVRYLAETLELVEDLIREAESQKLEENKKEMYHSVIKLRRIQCRCCCVAA